MKKIICIALSICSIIFTACGMPASADGNFTGSAFYMGEKILLTKDRIGEILEAAKKALDSKYELQLALSDDNIREYKENGCYISIDCPEETEFTVKGYEKPISDGCISIYISDGQDSAVNIGSHYYGLKKSCCKKILSCLELNNAE